MSKKQFFIICTFLVAIIVMLAYSIQQNNKILETVANNTKYIADVLETMSPRINLILEHIEELIQ